MPKATVTRLKTATRRPGDQLDTVRSRVTQAQCIAVLIGVAARGTTDYSWHIDEAASAIHDLLDSISDLLEQAEQAVQS